MDFDAARDTVIKLLRAKGRAKNSEILAALEGDRKLFERVREDLIFRDLAEDKKGVGLIYAGPEGEGRRPADTESRAESSPAAAEARREGPSPQAQARTRLFLSYGRLDAADLAARLKGDLETHGYEVWQDTSRIRAGQDWARAVADGLRSTQLVIALLSPHAVRKTRLPDRPDEQDSVCLDELSFARFASPAKPIVPVMAIPCEPPFVVFRLDYVDLCQWRDSEDQYRVGLQRLLETVREGLAGKVRYLSFFERHFPDSTSYAGVRRVLQVICAAREPLTETQIARASGLEPEDELPGVLRRVAAYLPEREGRYTVYHRSLADWLTGSELRGSTYYISVKRGHERLVSTFLSEYESGSSGMSQWGLREILFHAVKSRSENLVRRILNDPSYLCARIAATGTGSLIADLHLAGQEMPFLQPITSPFIRVLSRRSALLDQLPSLAAQELANQVPESCSARRKCPGSHAKGATRWELQQCGGPNDGQAIVLPPVVVDLAVSPDGTRMVTAGGMLHGLWTWKMPEAEPEAFMMGHRAGVSEARFLPDNLHLLSGSWDEHVMLWDVQTTQIVADFHAHEGFVQAIAVSPDGRLAASGGWDGRVVIYDLPGRSVAKTLTCEGGQINSIRMSPDGKRLLAAAIDGQITMWDVSDGARLRTWSGLRPLLNCIDVDWEREYLLACSLSGYLYGIPLSSGKVKAAARLDDVPLERVVAISRLGAAVTGDGRGRLAMWQLPDLQVTRQVQAHEGRCPAIAAAGDALITGGADQSVKAWDVVSLKPLWQRTTSRLRLVAADISSDGVSWWGVDTEGKVVKAHACDAPQSEATDANALVLQLQDNLTIDMFNAHEFLQAVADAAGQNPLCDVILDCAGLVSASSTCFGALFNIFADLEKSNRRFVLAVRSPEFLKQLTEIGLGEVILIAPDVDSAIAMLAKPG